jgi:hypothetical protein
MSLIIKKNTTFKIPRTGSGAPILWKIAFFAGAYTNGEYIRQSSESSIFVESSSGDNNYIQQLNPTTFLSVAPAQFGEDIPVYYSDDNAVTWVPEGNIEEPDLNPAPLAALSFSQSSYIQTIVLAGGTPDQSGTYSWDGTTFINGKPKYMGPLKSGATENNYIFWTGSEYSLYGWNVEEMDYLSSSVDLASNWDPNAGAGTPTVSSIIYTS